MRRRRLGELLPLIKAHRQPQRGLGPEMSLVWWRQERGGAQLRRSQSASRSGTMASKKGLSEAEKRTRMSEIFTSVQTLFIANY
jgi:hypothetical protein